MKSITLGISLLILTCLSIYSQPPTSDAVFISNGSEIRRTAFEYKPYGSSITKMTDNDLFAFEMDQVQEVTKDSSLSTSGRKSPALAFALSLVFPGAGQYYNGDVGKGLTQDALVAVGLVLVISEANKEGQNSYYGLEKGNSTFKATGIAMVLGASLWSIIDAPISASKKNKKAATKQLGHLVEFGDTHHVMGIDLGFHGQSFGANFTYHF